MVFSDENKNLIKSLYLKGYTAKRFTDEFSEKSWTKRSVNRRLKKLWDAGTLDRRPSCGRPRSARTEDKNSSGDEIANVNFLRRYGTYVLQNTKKENLLRLTN